VKARELMAEEDSEGMPRTPAPKVPPSVAPAPSSANSGALADPPSREFERAPPERLSKAMEDEVYSVLGALLGMLEVLSIDAQAPLTERQRRFVNDALRFGDMLRARVEALVTLFADERDPRFGRAPYALRRLIDHSIRAASWAAAEKGVSIVLPAGERWEADLLLVDAARVDRALRAITDTLVAALGKDGQVVLRVEDGGDRVSLVLSAHADGALPAVSLSLSAILLSAWEHVFRLQGGSLRVDAGALSVFMELPKVTTGAEP
jgi:hypothetical protein